MNRILRFPSNVLLVFAIVLASFTSLVFAGGIKASKAVFYVA